MSHETVIDLLEANVRRQIAGPYHVEYQVGTGWAKWQFGYASLPEAVRAVENHPSYPVAEFRIVDRDDNVAWWTPSP